MREVSDLQLHIYRGRGKPWGGGLEREKYDGGSSLGKDLQRVRIQEEVGRKFWKKKKWISLQRSWKGLHFAWIPATPPWWMSQPLQSEVSGSPVCKSHDELWPMMKTSGAASFYSFYNFSATLIRSYKNQDHKKSPIKVTRLARTHRNDVDQLNWTMYWQYWPVKVNQPFHKKKVGWEHHLVVQSFHGLNVNSSAKNSNTTGCW